MAPSNPTAKTSIPIWQIQRQISLPQAHDTNAHNHGVPIHDYVHDINKHHNSSGCSASDVVLAWLRPCWMHAPSNKWEFGLLFGLSIEGLLSDRQHAALVLQMDSVLA